MATFPNESTEYRSKRDELLKSEAELRALVERVARQRRELPLGGKVETDYTFTNADGGTIKLSELFADGKDSLVTYSFMYGPNVERPCPLCTSFLDSLDRAVIHARSINVAVVARSPIERILTFARSRNWSNLQLLSSADNDFNPDYFAEDADGNQWPMLNVFVRRNGQIHHQWASELLLNDRPEDMDHRHADQLWPLWHLLDLTPEGRGDGYPKLDYGD